ncbi:hypothetical protein [Inhella sp.]|uniref:hypothetical protein n=1 Tax=Inhella sp. TaxID=1921806 RepID=UPI0035AFB967
MQKALRAWLTVTKRYLAIFWVTLIGLACLWSATSYQALDDAQLQQEVLLRHGLMMMLLAAPSGWLLTALVGVVLQLAGPSITGLADALLLTAACGLSGYLQWFVLLPWLWRRWKGRSRAQTLETDRDQS